jgi:hypothetical protein
MWNRAKLYLVWDGTIIFLVYFSVVLTGNITQRLHSRTQNEWLICPTTESGRVVELLEDSYD